MLSPHTTTTFDAWYLSLSLEQTALVDRYVAYLTEFGIGLKHPYCSGFPGSKHGLRELRVQSTKHPMRIFYTFAPDRQPVLILGADKKGVHNEGKWTKKMLAQAEALYEAWLASP